MIDRIIAPAILATTFEDFKNSIQKIEHLFPYAHIDVMDGKFVPSISFQDIERINDLETEMEFELHLMVREPLREMEKWTLIKNVIRVIFHIETISDPTDCIAFVKQHWPQVGLALNPETPLSAIEPYINQVNAIQFMTIHPGQYGAEFLPEVKDKILKYTAIPDNKRPCCSVDGSVNKETIRLLKDWGAEVYNVGSALFKSDKPIEEAYKELESRLRI
jgi:ribulose-phosphate 3-epimerase